MKQLSLLFSPAHSALVHHVCLYVQRVGGCVCLCGRTSRGTVPAVGLHMRAVLMTAPEHVSVGNGGESSRDRCFIIQYIYS